MFSVVELINDGVHPALKSDPGFSPRPTSSAAR